MSTQVQFQMKDKVALVTGGAQGIGLEITKQFLQAGASVAVWDYSTEALDSCAKELSAFSGRLHTSAVDITNRENVRKAVEAIPWPVDILVNNAGITRDKSFAKMTEDDWDLVIQTNLTGLFNVTKSCLGKFRKDSMHCRIINISSVVALYGNFGQTNYAAAKAGVIGMTKTWAREFAKKGFTVNAIAPGFIETAMTKKMPTEVLAAMSSKVPVGRLGAPVDIANACLFLASEQAAYMNGTVISVDGGLTL